MAASSSGIFVTLVTTNVRVHGRVAFNTLTMIRQAALDGIGIAYVPHDLVEVSAVSAHGTI